MPFHSGSDSQFQFIRLKLLDGTQINGQIDLNRHPGYDTVANIISDYEDPFLTLDQVTIYGNDFQTRERYNVLLINKTQILWIEPKNNRGQF
ncbi:MAG: hypothetical protein MI863_22345 [Desulfobacterales bacterium]|nr:hypothetical protein [Desulfobacterales bacterium]